MIAKKSAGPAASTQVLVRLPVDLAERFAALVPSRKRSRYLVDLLRRELERESDELSSAAQLLSELESTSPEAEAEMRHWQEAALVQDPDEFDESEFERQFLEAQSKRR